MPPPATQRTVRCYHCGKRHRVSAKAMTVSCPACSKKLLVDDVVVTNVQAYRKLQTCGKLLVRKRGRVIAELVEAHGGVHVLGSVETRAYVGGPVVISAKGAWKGDCRATSVVIEPGAKITSGFFNVPDDSLGLSQLDAPEDGATS